MEKPLSKLYSSEKGKIFLTTNLLTTLEDVIAIEAMVNLYYASANKAIASLTIQPQGQHSTYSTTAGTSDFKCLFCKSEHSSRNCKRYGTIEKRRTFLAQEVVTKQSQQMG